MDKIILQDMQFYGYHGLFAEENKLGQRFNVNAELYLSLKQAGTTDHMDDSIHYGEAFKKVKEIVEGEPRHLIEAVAEDIAQELLTSFSKLIACKIKVIKPNPPIHGHYESVAVEIYRERISYE